MTEKVNGTKSKQQEEYFGQVSVTDISHPYHFTL